MWARRNTSITKESGREREWFNDREVVIVSNSYLCGLHCIANAAMEILYCHCCHGDALPPHTNLARLRAKSNSAKFSTNGVTRSVVAQNRRRFLLAESLPK